MSEKPRLTVSALRCPSCAASLPIRQKASETLACHSCGAIIDLRSEEHAVLGKTSPDKFAPESFIALGKIARLDGAAYEVIGRLSYSSRLSEWDSEDNRYYEEPWNWDTWVLLGEKKEFLYISEDREGYELSRSLMPTAPGIPRPGSRYFSLIKGLPPRLIQEHGIATVEYFEGEFTWRPELGDQHKFAEYRLGSETHSVEWRIDESGEPLEIEFFKSSRLSRLEAAVAFDEKAVIRAEQRKAARKQELKVWAVGFAAAAAICFLMIFVVAVKGKTVATYQTSLASMPEEGVVQGPFSLARKGVLHSVELRASIPDNSWAWTGVELLDEEQGAINAVEGDFWRESGYDSDGHWSESYVKNSTLFRLEAPGNYYVRVFSERGTASNGELIVAIYEGVGMYRWYVLGAVVNIMLMIGFFVLSQKVG